MPVTDYYFSKRRFPGFGKMYFLKVLQEADADGGGLSLLGSVLEEVRDWGFLWWVDYPLPFHLTTPGLVKAHIEQNRLVPPGGKVTLRLPVAEYQTSVSFARKDAFSGSVGDFPGIPANLKLDVDYRRMKEVKMSFGDGTYIEYIPKGFLAKLHECFEGKAERFGATVHVDDNLIVHEVMLAKSFSVQFESTEDFDAQFKAKLEKFESIPGIGAEYSVDLKAANQLSVKVAGDQYYLVALGVVDWDDLDDL